jgi:hypothetical protein
MAGEAKTNQFLLSVGTVMIGDSAKTMELTPELNSIGLTKNVSVTVDMGFVDLTQGLDDQVVCSVNTRNQARVAAEVYEFTARNIAYANGLNATGTDFDANTATLELSADVTGAASDIDLVDASDLSAGDFFVIQGGESSDMVHVCKVDSIATNTVTLADGYTIPAGTAFAAATARVYKVHDLDVGGSKPQATFGVKIVGLMAKDQSPITLIFPKVKITNGLGVSLTNSDFSNMPFEFMPYALLPGDAYYADFAGKQGKILQR